MRSMGLTGSEYGLFLNQLNAGHLELALTYAAGLKVIGLADALTVCQLMARDDDPRFPRAASRWIERLSAETGAGLLEVQMAAAALGKVWDQPEDEVALTMLRALAEG
jgi:hypothetical protein